MTRTAVAVKHDIALDDFWVPVYLFDELESLSKPPTDTAYNNALLGQALSALLQCVWSAPIDIAAIHACADRIEQCGWMRNRRTAPHLSSVLRKFVRGTIPTPVVAAIIEAAIDAHATSPVAEALSYIGEGVTAIADALPEKGE